MGVRMKESMGCKCSEYFVVGQKKRERKREREELESEAAGQDGRWPMFGCIFVGESRPVFFGGKKFRPRTFNRGS